MALRSELLEQASLAERRDALGRVSRGAATYPHLLQPCVAQLRRSATGVRKARVALRAARASLGPPVPLALRAAVLTGSRLAFLGLSTG